MADIFNRTIGFAGAFKPEDTLITLSGVLQDLTLVRNLNLTYEQQLSRIWDLKDAKVFVVAGHTNGTWTIGRVVGPAGGGDIFGKDVCNPGTITIGGQSGFCKPGGGRIGSQATYTLEKCILSQLTASVTSDDMILNEGLGGIFLSLSKS